MYVPMANTAQNKATVNAMAAMIIMNVLELKAVKDGDNVKDAFVYVSSYNKLTKKDGSPYISGTFTKQSDILSFKVWDAPLVKGLIENNLVGQVVKISGSASTYLNTLDFKVTSIQPVGEDVCSKALFLKSADVENIFKEFTAFVTSELTPNAQKILFGIFQGENILGRFKEEFAGSKMHDAQIGGLLNHTTKMLKIAKVVYENEPRMANLQYYKDMFYLSIVFHDIGKIYEMHLGVYQENSYVSHRILGVELLAKYKNAISQLFDEDFYYELISVLVGHHGEYGDKPTTVLAYIVHLIDMLDSQTTGIFDKIETNNYSLRAGSMVVTVDGMNLNV